RIAHHPRADRRHYRRGAGHRQRETRCGRAQPASRRSTALEVKWQELTAKGRGVGLHLRRVIEPKAPPLLLLHGLGVTGAVWQSFARRLLPTYAGVAPDLRGHGESDAPPDGYAPEDYAADLTEMIDELKLSPLPVVGHSLGALVALALT